MKLIQEDLIKSANQIRDKYRGLKRGKFMEDEERLLNFQPLITSLEPLQALAKEDKTKQIHTNIIKPLFKIAGEGIREVTGNKIDYIYWDDPNELVSRLRLLWLSREAGNSGVNNNIDSIIEEL